MTTVRDDQTATRFAQSVVRGVLTRRSLPANAFQCARTLRALSTLSPRARGLLLTVDIFGFNALEDVPRLAMGLCVSPHEVVMQLSEARAAYARAAVA
ncbi:MAG: hypothetical protein RKU31_01750 [Deltaproteobacteria bacterium]|jgi:hypothetical protein